jgi:hypothetical protein
MMCNADTQDYYASNFEYLWTLYTKSDAHPATDTQCCNAFFGVAALHLKQQRVPNTTTGCADGVTD